MGCFRVGVSKPFKLAVMQGVTEKNLQPGVGGHANILNKQHYF